MYTERYMGSTRGGREAAGVRKNAGKSIRIGPDQIR